MQEYIEPPDFQGLLYFDGLDSLGRPVVIVNSDAMGENRGARKSAFQYIVQVLEPIVIQVQSPSPGGRTRRCADLMLQHTSRVVACPTATV